jgi:hypothetical protein
MVLNAASSNIWVISWRLVLLMEETGENHRPVAGHWQTLSHIEYTSPHHTLIVVPSYRRSFHFVRNNRPQTTKLSQIHSVCRVLSWISLVDGGNWRKPSTCRRSLTNIITYRVYFPMSWIRTHIFSGDKYWLCQMEIFITVLYTSIYQIYGVFCCQIPQFLTVNNTDSYILQKSPYIW